MPRLTWSTYARGLTLGALALAIAGCQNLRGPVPDASVVIPPAYQNLPDSYAGAQGPSIASQGWQDFFADTRLHQLIELGLANNRDLRTTALNIERARQQYRISENGLIPTVDLSGSATRQETLQSPNATTVYSVGLGVTAYELDFFGRIRNLRDAALDSFLATRSARDATQISLIGQIAQAWLAISYDTAKLRLAEQTLKTQEEAYRLNRRRFEVGIDSELTVRQAQISVETARGDVAAFKTQIAQDRNLLELLVGQPVPAELLPTTQVQQITTNTALGAGLPSDLMQNRPDISSAEYQLRAAGGNLGAARALLYPSISLTGTAGLASTDLSDLFKSGSFIWSIGPRLDLPIFDAGTRRANVNIAEVDQELALNNYERAIQVAFREVSDVLATRATINDRLSAQTRLVDATATNYRLSEARFRAGIDNYLTVLDAQRSQYAAQQALLSLEQANLSSQIDLYKVLGGGLQSTTLAQPTIVPTSADTVPVSAPTTITTETIRQP
ncbi:AdeC/AdeK/OprM family multidrug efflux complex outer membrane factor [Alkanindiges sp. WGS2144]|uniref:AdeC/AdeK/OprM family multidrug efflux complex outer membrane factor n=1 Tax=Alkanindiges sp. WGS2144 TaxID=3366808 RepID=UPI003752852C